MKSTSHLAVVLALGFAVTAAAENTPSPAPTVAPEAQGPAAPAATQTPGTVAPDVVGKDHFGDITLGGQATDVTGNSSKFTEYRGVPEGVLLPSFHLSGRTSEMKYDFRGCTIQSDDQRYTLRTDFKSARIDADYTRLPHYFGNDGLSLLTHSSNGDFVLGSGLQQRYQKAITSIPQSGVTFGFLNNLVAPDLATGNRTDLKLVRGRARVNLDLTRGKPVDVNLSYFREDRTGSALRRSVLRIRQRRRAAGAVDYDPGRGRHRDPRPPLGLPWHRALHWFTMPSPCWGSRTRSGAPTAPTLGLSGARHASVNGPVFGRVALPPTTMPSRGPRAQLQAAGKTRVIADVSYGRWTQNQTPFIAYTTNASITVPAGVTSVGSLPTPQLDGSANVINQSYTVLSRPVPRLTLTARVRDYDFRNETPRVTIPGYVRFDAVWEDIGRISVPYAYRNDRADVTASYDLGRLTVEGGYKYLAFHREFRETEKTTENGVILAANLRAHDGVVLRASYEHATRGFDQYLAEESEDASFTNPGAPANLFAVPEELGGPVPSRYDQADKDFDRFNGLLQVAPNDKWSASVSYLYALENYNDFTPDQFTANTNLYGLNRVSYDSLAVDVDFTPTERVNPTASSAARTTRTGSGARQSGATVSLNPIDDWFSQVADRVDSYGGGAGFALIPQKLSLSATGRYQKVNGNNDISAPVGGAVEVAKRPLGGPLGFTAYDDTRLATVTTELTYTLPRSWAVTLGGWYEDYKIEDANAAPLNYLPAGSSSTRTTAATTVSPGTCVSAIAGRSWRLPMTTLIQTTSDGSLTRSSGRTAGRARPAVLVRSALRGPLTALTVDALRASRVLNRTIKPPSIPHEAEILCGDPDDRRSPTNTSATRRPAAPPPRRPERRGRDRRLYGVQEDSEAAHVGGAAGRRDRHRAELLPFPGARGPDRRPRPSRPCPSRCAAKGRAVLS